VQLSTDGAERSRDQQKVTGVGKIEGVMHVGVTSRYMRVITRNSYRRDDDDTAMIVIKAKCLPVLLYGLDACPVRATDRRALDFTVNRIL